MHDTIRVGGLVATVGSILVASAATAIAQERLTLSGHGSYVFGVAFTPDGKSLVSISRDFSACFWDAQTGRLRSKVEALDPIPRVVSLSPDGKTLAIGILSTGSEGKRHVAIYGLDGDAATLRARVPAFTVTPDSIAFSPDGRFLVFPTFDRLETGERRSQFQVVDPASGKLLTTFDPVLEVHGGHWSTHRSVAFSPDGRRLATGTLQGVVRIWQAGTWERTREIRSEHIGAVVALDFAPDGDLFVVQNARVTLRDAMTGEASRTLEGTFQHADLSPDGHMLATVSVVDPNASPNVSRLTLWDAAGFRKLAEVSREIRFNCVRFSPDGKSLATGNVSYVPSGPERSLHVWDVAKLLELGVDDAKP